MAVITLVNELIRRVEKACHRQLNAIGFERRYGHMVIDINEDVVGRVGLNRAVHRSEQVVEINPVVGAVHFRLELRLAQIKSDQLPKRYTASAAVFCHLGYLTPEETYRPYLLSADADADAVAAEIASDVTRFGMPFLHEHRTLKDFYLSMRDRRYGGIVQFSAYRLPVAALMLDMPDVARQHLEEFVRRFDERSGRVREEYRKFASAMRRELEYEPN